VAELRFETLCMPAARLGADDPLPAFRRRHRKRQAAFRRQPHSSLREDDLRYMGYGGDHGLLPYTIQSGYTRTLEQVTFQAAVLENDRLRALFLPEMGGRLWSLLHKPSGRELLAQNPGIQLANFALRGAWFSGGVEWNGCVRGHGPFTCSPLFAARVAGPDGESVLRFYEWERIRGVPFQMDFYLPDGRAVLLARMRLVNPHPVEVPMYWWSNIAVREAEDVRVLVPAREAIVHDYDHQLRRALVPHFWDRDVTYSTNLDRAVDFFYCIEGEQRPWVAALDGTGRGLFQASTSRLRGRKLFAWGSGPGGRRWQQFLAGGGPPYIEIQAGLARTQAEFLPMPAGATWEWLEAYGIIEADADSVHGDDWDAACREVEQRLEAIVTQEWLAAELARSRPMADTPPAQVVQRGSGWGALELRRRAASGERPFCSEALVFDGDSLGSDQQPWKRLLTDGAIPETPPDQVPSAWMVQNEWRELLEASVACGGAHWLSWLHLGVMRQNGGDFDGARDAYRASVECKPSAWAYRNLAVLAKSDERLDEAADLLVKAMQLAPGVVSLAVECARALMHAGRATEAGEMLDSAPSAVAAHPRVQIVRAQAALAADDLQAVEDILLSGIELSDLREGEKVLTELWFEMQAKRVAASEGVVVDDELRRRVRREFPAPRVIDFRMAPEQSVEAK